MLGVRFTSTRSDDSDSCVANIALFNVIDHPVFPARLSAVVPDILGLSGNNIRRVRMSAHRVRLRRVSGDLYPANQGKDKDKREGK